MRLDLVVLGNLLVDDVVLPDGRTRMAEPGGAALYVALGAWLWGLRVGIVAVRGDEYPVETLESLASRGIALEGVARLGRPGLRTWLLYEGVRRQIIHRLDGPTHLEMSPAPGAIPADWRDARAFHLTASSRWIRTCCCARTPSQHGRGSCPGSKPCSSARTRWS